MKKILLSLILLSVIAMPVFADSYQEAPNQFIFDYFNVSPPASVVAGVPFYVTVSAVDTTYNPYQLEINYAGSIELNATGLSNMPIDFTFTNPYTYNGSEIFALQLMTAGPQQ